MCGITGILNLDGRPASSVVVGKMTRLLAHRGPNDEGVYSDGPIAIGHRRLSIIDLSSAGHQPMIGPGGRFVMVYNGEIYNFQELRTELQAQGVPFHSRTDSEVVLKGFVTWGKALLERLNGMFALAIWDKIQQKLFLARDRYGIKPLYLTRIGNTFLFGSEIKAFLGHPDFSPEMDSEGLVEYLTFQNFFSERTLFDNVSLFPAAHYLEIDLRNGSTAIPAPRQFWDYRFQEPEQPEDKEVYLEELDRLFVQAVERQLVSDVEIGSYLSGGMDSGSITALAARNLGLLKTFTIGFDLHSASGLEMGFDERELAEYMSYLFRTEHYEMVLKAGDMERCMSSLVWHLEEPRVGQSYPNFYAAHLTARFCRVVLNGAGGDELFGGYPWRYYRAVVNSDFEQYVDKYYEYWQRLIPTRHMEDVFSPISDVYMRVIPRDIFAGVFKYRGDRLSKPEDYVNHSLYFEAKTFLHGLLVVEDKLSMAHGLESRVPFLDNDLVDFAQQVPVGFKLGNLGEVAALNENVPGHKKQKYFQKTRDGKLLLREAMRRHMPLKITDNIKQGFSAPDASWFKGESIDYVRRKLFGKNVLLYEYLDRDTVHGLVNDHLEGRHNRRLLIWSLLNLEAWLRIFPGGRWKDIPSRDAGHWEA